MYTWAQHASVGLYMVLDSAATSLSRAYLSIIAPLLLVSAALPVY